MGSDALQRVAERLGEAKPYLPDSMILAARGARERARSPARGSETCSWPSGSLYNRKLQIVYRAGCGRWGCRPCSKRKRAMLARRFERVRWQRQPAMVTLTAARVEDADPTPEAMARFSKRVRSFRRWVVRHYGKVNWLWVREVADRGAGCICLEALACRCGAGGGRLHVHMLWDAPYVLQSLLSVAAVRSGLGGILDVRRVATRRGVRYVAKYLTKSNFPAGRTRRFAVRAPEPSKEPTDWLWDPRRPALVAVDQLGCYEIDYDAEGWCAYERGPPT